MRNKAKKAGLVLLFLLGIALCLYAAMLPVWAEDGVRAAGVELYTGDQAARGMTRTAVETALEVLELRGNEPGVQEMIWTLRLYLVSDLLFWGGAALAVAASVLIISMKGEGQRKNRFDARRTALCGVLLSLMLILGWVERMIPMPNGIKLGLSNSVLIFAVCMLDIPTAYILMIYKVFLSNLLFGNLGTTFMMGFAGGLLSLTAMVGISRIKGMHTVTVSIVGGVCHNIGQVMMAMLLMENAALLSLLPWLMLSGMGFGALTGVAATMTMKHLKHMRF